MSTSEKIEVVELRGDALSAEQRDRMAREVEPSGPLIAVPDGASGENEAELTRIVAGYLSELAGLFGSMISQVFVGPKLTRNLIAEIRERIAGMQRSAAETDSRLIDLAASLDPEE